LINRSSINQHYHTIGIKKILRGKEKELILGDCEIVLNGLIKNMASPDCLAILNEDRAI
jgi:hypothetical protein